MQSEGEEKWRGGLRGETGGLAPKAEVGGGVGPKAAQSRVRRGWAHVERALNHCRALFTPHPPLSRPGARSPRLLGRRLHGAGPWPRDQPPRL